MEHGSPAAQARHEQSNKACLPLRLPLLACLSQETAEQQPCHGTSREATARAAADASAAALELAQQTNDWRQPQRLPYAPGMAQLQQRQLQPACTKPYVNKGSLTCCPSTLCTAVCQLGAAGRAAPAVYDPSQREGAHGLVGPRRACCKLLCAHGCQLTAETSDLGACSGMLCIGAAT